MIHDYLIAGHRIRVEGERLVQAVDALTGFIPFKVMADGEPLCHFVESTTEAPLFETVLYTNEIDGIVSHFGRYNNGFLLVMLPPEGEALELWLDKKQASGQFQR